MIVQERIIEMYDSGQGFRVADKLNELMHCGNEQIELAACALFERFTRDDLRADTGDMPEIEIKDFSGKQPYVPPGDKYSG